MPEHQVCVYPPCPACLSLPTGHSDQVAIYSHTAEYLVMPLENTLQGAVHDTVDCLLSPLHAGPKRGWSGTVSGNIATASPSSVPLRLASASPSFLAQSKSLPSVGEATSTPSHTTGAGPSSSSHADHPPPPRILADLLLPIRHCLVARRGTTMESIRWVRSHEQVR